MVQNFGRVVVAVAALNAAVTLAQSQTDSFELEAREEVPYVRRHFTREELAEREARELDLEARSDFYDLEAREEFDQLEAREPEPIHVPFFSNWNAGRKQRNADRQRGKQERVQAEKSAEGGGAERRELYDEPELEARDFDMEELEAREPEPLHVPFFSDWNAGRKQRNADRQRGKKERLQAEKSAEGGAERRELYEPELDAREFNMEELEAREPEPIHVPFFSNWNAGRKQRNADRQRGKQERVQAEKSAESSGGAERRDLDGDLLEFEAREYDDVELEAREPEPEPIHVPFFSDWNAGRKQRNEDRKKGKEERLAAEKSAGISTRSVEFELDELD